VRGAEVLRVSLEVGHSCSELGERGVSLAVECSVFFEVSGVCEQVNDPREVAARGSCPVAVHVEQEPVLEQ